MLFVSRIVFFFFFFSFLLHANTVVLDNTTPSYSLNKAFDVRISTAQTPQALHDKKFQPYVKYKPLRLKDNENMWFKCTVRNESKNMQWVVYDDYRWTWYMTLYVVDEYNNTTTLISGEKVAMKERAYENAQISFPITLQKNRTYTLYFKVKSMDYKPQVSIIKATTFFKTQEDRSFFQGLLAGAIGALILYNLFLALNLRSFLYASYVGYMTFMLLFITADNGVLFTYIHPNVTQFSGVDKIIYISIALVWLVAFSGHFLQTRIFYKRFYYFMFVYAWTVVALAVYNVFNATFFVFLLFNILLIGAVVLVIINLVLAHRKKVKVAKYYTLGYSMFLLLSILTVLNNMHVIEFAIGPKWGVSMGVALEGIIFSYALYWRLQLSEKERRTFEQESRQKDEMLQMQSRMATIGEMTANIIHQSKQPLSAIASIVSTMHISSKLEPLKPEKIDECVHSVNEQIKLLQDTSRDFLNYYRPDKESKRFSLNDAVKQAVKFTQNSMKMKHITMQITEQETVYIDGYANELNQVIINLLNNAKDAHISNQTNNAYVILDISKNSTHAVLQVKDNAGGIQASVLSTLFEPFVTTKEDKGTGIGLHMCKQIMTQSMQGSIAVYNKNEGACFTLTMPLAKNA